MSEPTEDLQRYKTFLPGENYGVCYIVIGGCPKCKSDLKVMYGVAGQCINWQHPHVENDYSRAGNRSCDYSLTSG